MNLQQDKPQICDCCSHLPMPPSASIAQLSLIKQLNLYLELEALLSKNKNENDDLNKSKESNYDDDDIDDNYEDDDDEDIDEENIEDYDDSFCRNFSFVNDINDDLKSPNKDGSFIETNCNNSVNSKSNEPNNKFAYSYELNKNIKATTKNYSLNDSYNNNNRNNSNVTNNKTVCDNNSSRAEEDEFDSIDENDLDYIKKMNLLNMNMNSKHMNKIDKLKPLIPSYLFNDLINNLNSSNTLLSSNSNEPLIGRDWIFKEIEKSFETNQICLISGASGTGKTKLVQHLFKISSMYQNVKIKIEQNQNESNSSMTSNHSESTDRMKNLASNLATVHFCLSDDMRSFESSQFITNLAWSLINFDQLTKTNSNSTFNVYKQFLTDNCNNLMTKLMNEDACKLEPDILLRRCILEPLEALVNTQLNNKFSYFYVIIDGLDTIQTDSKLYDSNKNNLAYFIINNIDLFPNWFKFVITLRSEDSLNQFKENKLVKLNYYSICLDNTSSSGCNSTFLTKDLNDYISYRINKSVEIQKNILYFNTTGSNTNSEMKPPISPNAIYNTNSARNANTSPPLTMSSTSPSLSYTNYSPTSSNNQMTKLDSNFQAKFINYLSSLSQFSFLFAKLTLDLIEKGNLVIKSSNFKVLPKKMDDLFKLYFNLKFSSRLAYDRLAMHIFAICLASYRPLTLDDLFEALNCSYFSEKFTMNELLDQISHLDGFLISFSYFDPDLDFSNSAYIIKTQLYAFAHPALRDWWLEYHNINKLTPQPIKSLKNSHDSEWGHFLLSMRLFRSIELQEKLDSIKYSHTIRIYLDLIKHLIKSESLINESMSKQTFNTISYLLTCFLPFNLSNHKALRKNSKTNNLISNSIYTNLLISSEFLAAPDPNLFRILIRLGADFNSNVDYFNSIPFICVLARLGYSKLLLILINEFDIIFDSELNSSKIIHQDQNGTNCLSYATQYGNLECAKLILENSKNQIRLITQIDLNGYCALTYASATSKNMIDLLDHYMKKINQSDELTTMERSKLIQQTLILSSMNANKKCLNYLLNFCIKKSNSSSKINDLMISIDGVDTLKGETALTAACTNGHKSICELLIESSNASVITPNSKSWTPLLCAVKSGEWEIVEYLLSKNNDIINQSDKHGRDSLILAASEGHLAIIDILIEKGADLTSHDRDGLSALSWSCLKGHYNAALTLLNNGIDINHADFSGRTPLDLATFYGDVRLVQLLIEKGAQIEHIDNIGMRPLDRAIGCRNVPVVVCFLKKGAKLSPATWAMAAGKPEIIITLLNKLVEDGNTLYRKGSYLDALHRYSYTLKKFPKDPSELAILPDNVKAIIEMKFNLLLNLARCHRKLQEYQSSIDLCTKAIELKQDSYEAFYSRARAKRDLKDFQSALEDLEVATKLCPTNSDLKKLKNKINEEMNTTNSSTLRLKVCPKNKPVEHE